MAHTHGICAGQAEGGGDGARCCCAVANVEVELMVFAPTRLAGPSALGWASLSPAFSHTVSLPLALPPPVSPLPPMHAAPRRLSWPPSLPASPQHRVPVLPRQRHGALYRTACCGCHGTSGLAPNTHAAPWWGPVFFFFWVFFWFPESALILNRYLLAAPTAARHARYPRYLVGRGSE
jgi:hypothetical protein